VGRVSGCVFGAQPVGHFVFGEWTLHDGDDAVADVFGRLSDP